MKRMIFPGVSAAIFGAVLCAPITAAAETQFECYVTVHEGCYNAQDGEPPCSDETYDAFLNACDAEAEEAKSATVKGFKISTPRGLSRDQRGKFAKVKRYMLRNGHLKTRR